MIELLVVIAIIAILAAILFPVFAQAKVAAKKAASISNQKQIMTGSIMYSGDYDDMSALIQYNNTYAVASGDRALLQIVNPYMKNSDIWKDPNSGIGNNERLTIDLVNPATVPAQWQALQREFNFAIKADYGYNTQYFSPMGAFCPEMFRALSISMTQIGSPADTIMFANSVWDRAGGSPRGGGNWGIDMPCRRYTDLSDSLPPVAPCTARWWWGGWAPTTPGAWNEWGGMYPYHAGRAVIGWADGHASVLSVSQTTRGCDVRAGWAGQIFDSNVYVWDLR